MKELPLTPLRPTFLEPPNPLMDVLGQHIHLWVRVAISFCLGVNVIEAADGKRENASQCIIYSGKRTTPRRDHFVCRKRGAMHDDNSNDSVSRARSSSVATPVSPAISGSNLFNLLGGLFGQPSSSPPSGKLADRRYPSVRNPARFRILRAVETPEVVRAQLHAKRQREALRRVKHIISRRVSIIRERRQSEARAKQRVSSNGTPTHAHHHHEEADEELRVRETPEDVLVVASPG